MLCKSYNAQIKKGFKPRPPTSGAAAANSKSTLPKKSSAKMVRIPLPKMLSAGSLAFEPGEKEGKGEGEHTKEGERGRQNV
jgi:hypothetical protein